MSFLVDISQIEQSGIDYVSGLLSSGYVHKTGDIINGDLLISSNLVDLYLYGALSSNSGVIFDAENKRIGIGGTPEYPFHIKEILWQELDIFNLGLSYYDEEEIPVISNVPYELGKTYILSISGLDRGGGLREHNGFYLYYNDNLIATLLDEDFSYEFIFDGTVGDLFSFEVVNEEQESTMSIQEIKITRQVEPKRRDIEIFLNNENPYSSSRITMLTDGDSTGQLKNAGNARMEIFSNGKVIFIADTGVQSASFAEDGISCGALGLDGNIFISGFESFQPQNGETVDYFGINDCSARYYDCNIDGDGSLTFGTSRGIGNTGYYLSTGTMSLADRYATMVRNGELNVVSVTGRERGIWIAGQKIQQTDIAKQYFITGEDLGILSLDPECDDFYTGDFTLYIKRVGEFRPVDIFGMENCGTANEKSIIKMKYRSGIESDTNEVCFWMSARTGENSTIYSLQFTSFHNEDTRSIEVPATTGYGKNQIFLWSISPYDCTGRVALYDSVSKNREIYSGEYINPTSNCNSEDGTRIILHSGCLYEYGLVKRAISPQEEAEIFERANLLDCIPVEDIGFLFKMNAGSGSIVFDGIGGYAGEILQFDESNWR